MAKEKSAKFLSKSKENCPVKLREKTIIDDGNMCGLIKLGPMSLCPGQRTTAVREKSLHRCSARSV